MLSWEARIEMELDGITELDVAESILNAVAIYKTIRSQSPFEGKEKNICISFKVQTSKGCQSIQKENW